MSREEKGHNDWETLKMMLDQFPALKQRVLYRIKAIRRQMEERNRTDKFKDLKKLPDKAPPPKDEK